jgi:hypothetical protein
VLLAAAMPADDRDVLVTMWRRRTWGLSVAWHAPYVRARVAPLWRDLLAVTMPDVATLDRWERDHGYVSR